MRTSDHREAARVLSLLEAGGIPCHAQLDRVHIGSRAIFVVFDKHYQDAVALLRDPNHVVVEPVDIRDYEAFQSKFDHSVLLRYVIIWLVLALVAVGLVVALSMR